MGVRNCSVGNLVAGDDMVLQILSHDGIVGDHSAVDRLVRDPARQDRIARALNLYTRSQCASVDGDLQIKRRVVAEGLAVNAPIADDALDVLCKLGGYDHAGLAGMILGGARRGIPTMIDGVNATAAAMLAWGIYPECADYMLCSHLSEEIAHRRMLSQLNLHPIVDAGMRLGEGTGASLAVVVLQTALGLYKEMNRQ